MAFGTPPFNARASGDGVFAGMGVVGTMGTTDSGGTAQLLAIAVNPITGAQYSDEIGTAIKTVQIVGGTINAGTVTTSLAINSGTLSTLGTAGTVLGVGGTLVENLAQWGGASVTAAGTLSDAGTSGTTFMSGAVLYGYNGGGGVNPYDRVFLYAAGDSDNNDRGLLVQTLTKVWDGAHWNRLKGTAGTAFVAVGAGTQQTLGTVGVVNNIVTGTLAATGTTTGIGTLTNVGSVSQIGQVFNAGTLQAMNIGTVTGKDANAVTQTAQPVGIGGTDSGGTIRTITVNSSGQQTTNLTSSGTLLNLATGTLAAVTSVTNLVGGTVTAVNNIVTGTLAAVTTVTTLSNLTNGSVNILTGTLQSSGTTTGVGVVTALTNGSINVLSGTLQVSPIPTIGQSTFGTHGTTGATVFGTLGGGTSSGAGTEIFVTSVSLTIPSTGGSQDVSIGWGTNGGTFHAGTGLIVRGNFPAGGGIQKTFAPAINSGTNAQLTVFQAGAGTVDVNVSFFVTASTL